MVFRKTSVREILGCILDIHLVFVTILVVNKFLCRYVGRRILDGFNLEYFPTFLKSIKMLQNSFVLFSELDRVWWLGWA